jgi:hypothetical protein
MTHWRVLTTAPHSAHTTLLLSRRLRSYPHPRHILARVSTTRLANRLRYQNSINAPNTPTATQKLASGNTTKNGYHCFGCKTIPRMSSTARTTLETRHQGNKNDRTRSSSRYLLTLPVLMKATSPSRITARRHQGFGGLVVTRQFGIERFYCDHSTVTDFARFLGLSTSCPRRTAAWYASSCSGTTVSIGLRHSSTAGT